MRADIPARRRFDIECKTLENIVYEVTLDKTKWLIYAIYRPPSMANALTPVLKLSVLKQRLFLLVSITSTNDGSHPFIKHVGFLTIFVKSKISHKSSSTL
jgi:hypothetical protein